MVKRSLNKHFVNYHDDRVYAIYYKATHTIYYNLTHADDSRIIIFKLR